MDKRVVAIEYYGDRYVSAAMPDSNGLVECPSMGRGRVKRLTHDNLDNYITIQWIGQIRLTRYRFTLVS